MRPAARIFMLISLMMLATGLLIACASGPLRRRIQQTSTVEQTSTPPIITVVTLQPTTELILINEQSTVSTASPTKPTATMQVTLIDETIGEDLESLLDQLYITNIAGDGLEDVK